jgi:hypothetical protein
MREKHLRHSTHNYMFKTSYEKQVAHYKKLARKESQDNREVVALVALTIIALVYFLSM